MQFPRVFRQQVDIVRLEVHGPEPIGFAQSEVLAVTAARHLNGTGGGHIPHGAPGDVETTDQSRWADPQQFIGGPTAPRGAGTLLRVANDGIPGTTAPVGIPNSITDMLGTLP